MLLTLVRHGALDTKYDNCYVGRRDVPLSARGHAQAEHLAGHLHNRGVDALWCSPALRARQTAAPLAARLNLDVEIVPALNEVDFGRWEGLTFAQMCEQEPELVQQWADNAADFCFPAGEAPHQFNQRVATAAQRLLGAHYHHLVLVAHGGVIRHLLCQLLELPRHDYLKFQLERGGYATMTISEQRAVLTGLYNEHC